MAKTYEKRQEVVGSIIRVNFKKGEKDYEQVARLKAIYSSKVCREIMGDLIAQFLASPEQAQAKTKDKG